MDEVKAIKNSYHIWELKLQLLFKYFSFDDFYRNFETIQFCDLTPDALSGELLKKTDPSKSPKLTWKLTSYDDKWYF